MFANTGLVMQIIYKVVELVPRNLLLVWTIFRAGVGNKSEPSSGMPIKHLNPTVTRTSMILSSIVVGT